MTPPPTPLLTRPTEVEIEAIEAISKKIMHLRMLWQREIMLDHARCFGTGGSDQQLNDAIAERHLLIEEVDRRARVQLLVS